MESRQPIRYDRAPWRVVTDSSADMDQEGAEIQREHPELADWHPAEVGSAWGSYSLDIQLVSWHGYGSTPQRNEQLKRENTERTTGHFRTICPASPGKSSLLIQILNEYGIRSNTSSTVGGFRELEINSNIPVLPMGRMVKRTSTNGSVYYIWQQELLH